MPRRPITENTLFYGDNLEILREYITDESIDLVYLDPPFKVVSGAFCSFLHIASMIPGARHDTSQVA